MKTPEEARKAWVEALRSGEYKQGKQLLHADDRFCCLGVACKLAVEDGVIPQGEPLDPDEADSPFAYQGLTGWVPGLVQQWLGLSADMGEYTARNGRETSLARRNDSGLTFSRIAEIIESEPKGLFTDG